MTQAKLQIRINAYTQTIHALRALAKRIELTPEEAQRLAFVIRLRDRARDQIERKPIY